MQVIKGGYSFVEFDSASTFSAPKKIEQLLKAGTGFTPKTLTEDFADNNPHAAAKALDMTIRSANVDNSAASPYALLKTAEESRTKLFFRFVKMLSESIVVHACDAAWNEAVVPDGTSTTDAVDFKEGTKSAKLTFASGSNPGDLLASVVVSKNLTSVKVIKLWVKSRLAKDRGDLQLWIDNTANCVSPLEVLPFPALAAYTWTEVNLVLLNPSALASIISIGIVSSVGVGSTDVIHIDNVRGVTGYVIQLNNIIPKVDFEMNEAGKHNAIKIVGEGFADTEANLLTTNF